MAEHLSRITDWDDAYANAAYIPGADEFITSWESKAKTFRKVSNCQLDIVYGAGERNHMDLFWPKGKPKGLQVFVHGGYWLRFDKSYWSHLAKDLVEAGFAVAMPSYTLCPSASISEIVAEISAAITTAAKLVDGQIVLNGHSAGGHLVTRQVCTDTILSTPILERITTVVSISGVHDLRPLLKTKLNETLKLSDEEATLQSPALLKPIEGVGLHCVVGDDERPEFIRQNALLANIWAGLGASTKCTEIANCHHFDVIDHIGEFA